MVVYESITIVIWIYTNYCGYDYIHAYGPTDNTAVRVVVALIEHCEY